MPLEQIHTMIHVMWICIACNISVSIVHWFKGNTRLVYLSGGLTLFCMGTVILLTKYGGS